MSKIESKLEIKLLEVFNKLDIEYKKSVIDFAELALSSQDNELSEDEFDIISKKMHEMNDKMIRQEDYK